MNLLFSTECFFHDSDRKNHPIRITDKQASVTIELHPLYVGQALPILEENIWKRFSDIFITHVGLRTFTFTYIHLN